MYFILHYIITLKYMYMYMYIHVHHNAYTCIHTLCLSYMSNTGMYMYTDYIYKSEFIPKPV